MAVGFYSKMVYRILSILSEITFHSIPSDQFQIGGHIFIFTKFSSYVITYGYFRKLIISSSFENILHTITKFEPIPYETQSVQDWVQRLLVRDRLSQPTPIAYTEMYGVWM